MAEPFLSEIRIMSFVFAPKGWALCNGQLLPINQNQALFTLLGTTFGGDGRVNFALPDLRGRTPIHVGSGHTLGERGGEQAHTLSIAELPTHTHVAQWHHRRTATSARFQPEPAGRSAAIDRYLRRRIATWRRWQPATVANVGGSQAHLNMQPFLTLDFLYCASGHFPVAELKENERWHNHMSVKSECLRATSLRRAGCFAKASCCRSPRTKRCFNLIGTTYGGDGRIDLCACPTCAAASRFIRATASSWPRPAAPRRSR